MYTATDTERQSKRASEQRFAPSIYLRLSRVAERVLAYAQAAKVQHFRYCQKPLSPRSPHASLAQAVNSLDADLQQAAQRPTCQTLAVELLTELAALAHQPPCQTTAEQQAAARVINSTLLQLR